MKNLGWQKPDEAIGEHVEFLSNTEYNKTGEVIGVVRDFYFKSMHQEIEPLAFKLNPAKLSYLYIRVKPDKKSEAVTYLSNLWSNKYPETEFNYFYL